jgi:radical SAM protein with 4Fe4S-binding SPASM domain
MRVILTHDPTDLGEGLVCYQENDCDCVCACPTDGAPTPVLSLPLVYYLELTSACNNRCPGCGNVYGDARASLPPPLDGPGWRDLLARLASHAQYFKLTGGEATLHPAFDEIVRALEDLGVSFTLFTNGRWSRPAALVGSLRNSATCEGLLISLHGPDAATHEAFSGVPGSFDETVSNVRRAVDAGLDVALSLVINRHNWDRIEGSLRLALSLGAGRLVCNRLIGAPGLALLPSQAQLRAAMATVEALRGAGRAIRFGNCIPQCFEISSSRGCTAGSTFATVDPWGRMRPCNHAGLVAGDLRAQPVAKVWHGEIMTLWRALVPQDCAICPAFASCHGGCRAQALLTGTQDPLIQAPLAGTSARPEVEMLLYAGLRPVGRFTRRSEGGGEMLVHKGQVATVPAACGPLARKLDGSLTLRQVEHRYGAHALEWVGTLYQDGFVTLQS